MINLNISRSSIRHTWRALASALLCLASASVLLGDSTDGDTNSVSEYIHKTLSSENGYSGGPLYAFAQTNDGYLWIGSEKGLIRFDGLKFRLFQYADNSNTFLGPVLGLTTDVKGSLWVRLQGAHLFRYHDGKFDKPPARALGSRSQRHRALGRSL